MSELSKTIALKALKKLDSLLEAKRHSKIRLIVGGGSAMVLAHNFPGQTDHVDSIATIDFSELSDDILQVAKEFGLSGDWLNPYYSSYAHYPPGNYDSRLIQVLQGSVISVEALGVEDLLIMKLMAGRAKDMKHIRFLFHKKVDLSVIDKRLAQLKTISPKEALNALDLFDDLKEELGVE